MTGGGSRPSRRFSAICPVDRPGLLVLPGPETPPQARRDRHLMPRFLRHDDWFRALSRPGDDPGRVAQFMDSHHQADGIAVRVTELTGHPEDVVLAHRRVLHSGAPNTGSYPRMMLTKNLYRRGIRAAAA
jgi:hypothetical protein